MYTTNVVQSETVTATAALTAHRAVSFAGGLPAAAGDAIIGIARTDAATGEQVAVDVLGRVIVEAADAVAVGAALQANADGRLKLRTGSNVIVGRALDAATAAGDFIRVQLGVN